jgi:hypothetical protein
MMAAERAETHLRLMAESELRRALAYPRQEPPEPSALPPAVRSAVRLSSPLLAPLLPPVRSAARVSGPLLAPLWPAARTAALAARQTTVGRAAEPVLWRVLRARQAVRPFLAGRDRFVAPRADAGLDRVRLVASALVQAGVIGEDVAQATLDSLTDALAIRDKLPLGRLDLPPGSASWGPGSRWPLASSPPPLPGRPVRAMPLGTTLPLGPGGDLGEVGLLALVLAPDRAVLTAVARLTQPGTGPRRPGWRPPAPLPFGALVATDEHGAQYQAGHSAQSAYGRWSIAFELTPVPPPGIRRLDITGPAIDDAIRVDLTRTPGPGSAVDRDPAGPDSTRQDSTDQVSTGPVSTGPVSTGPVFTGPNPGRSNPAGADPVHRGALPGRLSPAERPLDALAERLLADVAHGYDPDDGLFSGLAEVVGALQATAGLTVGSAALSRLAVLARRLGIDFPADLRPRTRPVELPDAWASVLDHRGATDGPDRAAAVAAVLPEVDGARFALAGLDSVADSATLRVVAWGWQPSPRPGLGGERFSWWARDDGGRWHLARERGAQYGGGQVDLLVEFGPALHPGTRALEIIVRGSSGQAAVTVPLRWLVSR